MFAKITISWENFSYVRKIFCDVPPQRQRSVEDKLGDMDELDKVSIAKDLKADFEEFADFIADRELKSSLNQINDALSKECYRVLSRSKGKPIFLKFSRSNCRCYKCGNSTGDKRNSKNF
jgi:hypothetical protein